MNDKSLADILSGAKPDPVRADLHAALGALLDAADLDGGQLDPPAFWGFVAGLAAGRGIADELGAAAASMVAANFTPDDPAELWRLRQWGILFHLLKRIGAFKGELVPESFLPTAFTAPALNRISRTKRYPDLLKLGTNDRASLTLAQGAKCFLVQAVLFQKAKRSVTEREAMAQILPPEGQPTALEVTLNEGFWRTWAGKGGWKSQAADWSQLTVKQMKDQAIALAREETAPWISTLTDNDKQELWSMAYGNR